MLPKRPPQRLAPDARKVQLLLERTRSDRARIATLEREVGELRAILGLGRPSPLRPSKAQAKVMIRRLFARRDADTLYPDDVADALNLDISLSIEVCRELADEGAIAERR